MLYRQCNLLELSTGGSGTAWIGNILAQISKRFSLPAGNPGGFPCIFAQHAYARGNFMFITVPFNAATGAYEYAAIANDLHEYLLDAAEWDGSINSAKPLLVIFEPNTTMQTEDDYEKVFIETLQFLIDNDSSPWVDHVPNDPNREFWSMCFGGTQIFINVSHPLHIARKSRNLCDALVLVINPRERFDRVAGSDKKGNAIRDRIRANIDIYDDVMRSPFLGHYLKGDAEWPQYMLPDDNTSPPRLCPLKFR